MPYYWTPAKLGEIPTLRVSGLAQESWVRSAVHSRRSQFSAGWQPRD